MGGRPRARKGAVEILFGAPLSSGKTNACLVRPTVRTGALRVCVRVQESRDWSALGRQGDFEGFAAEAPATAKGVPSAGCEPSLLMPPVTDDCTVSVAAARRGAGHPPVPLGRRYTPPQCTLYGQLVSGRELLLPYTRNMSPPGALRQFYSQRHPPHWQGWDTDAARSVEHA